MFEIREIKAIESIEKKNKKRDLHFLYNDLFDLRCGSPEAKEILKEIEKLESEIAMMI